MRNWCILILLFFFSIPSSSFAEKVPQTFDLKNWNPLGAESFPLKGQWSFVWDQLIPPKDFLAKGLPENNTILANFPGLWVTYQKVGYGNSFGKGTYFATLKNVPPNQTLFFKITQSYSAFKIFFIQNKSVISVWENGKIGLSKEKERPGKFYALKAVSVGRGDITIIVHLTNHFVHSGGIVKNFDVGNENNLLREDQRRQLISTFVFSSLFIIGVYHLIFYFIRKKDKTLLWFGTFCIATSIRTATVEPFIDIFGPPTNFKFIFNHTIAYISVYFVLPSLVTYLRGLFENFIPKFLERFIWFFNGIYILTVFLPTYIMGNKILGNIWQITAVILGVSILFCVLKAAFKKAPFARLILISIIIVLATTVYDILASNFDFLIKDVGTWGMILFIMAQCYLLSKKFSNAFDTIEEMKENLEETVKERTTDLELQAIELEDLMEKIFYQKKAREDLLSHIGDAYMVFNKKGVIQEGSNQKSESMFECDLFESEAKGTKIWDILRLKNEKLETFKKWINNIYKGTIKFQDLLPFAPKYFEDNKFIELQFRPIYKSERDKVVEKVICIGSDKRKEKMIEEKMEKDRLKFEFVTHCLRNPVEFIDLVDETFDLFRNWFKLKKQDKESLFRTFHNLKAKLSQFSIKSSAIIVHDIETHIMEEKNTLIEKRFQDLQREMKQFLKDNRMIVEAANKFIVAEGHAIRINELIDQAKKFNSIEDLLEHINKNYVLRDIKDKFKIFAPLVKEISEKLGKNASFEILGEKILLDLNHYESFLNSSVHIIRNMLDHGLETEDERVKAGKDKEGKVKISILKKEKTIRISFQDDGRGIDTKRLRFVIVEKGLANEEEANEMKPKDLYQFLFNPLFSTKEEVSELSGRGVGLDVIKKEVDNLKGTIEVLSTEGKGTQFIIELPLFK